MIIQQLMHVTILQEMHVATVDFSSLACIGNIQYKQTSITNLALKRLILI